MGQEVLYRPIIPPFEMSTKRLSRRINQMPKRLEDEAEAEEGVDQVFVTLSANSRNRHLGTNVWRQAM